MFIVLENGKPATCNFFNVAKSWDNAEFDTWEGAVQYANHWLGAYGGAVLTPNEPWEYNNGSTIEIRKVD